MRNNRVLKRRTIFSNCEVQQEIHEFTVFNLAENWLLNKERNLLFRSEILLVFVKTASHDLDTIFCGTQKLKLKMVRVNLGDHEN